MHFSTLLISAITALITSSAIAGGANKVRSPYVTQGQWKIEHYGTVSFENENVSDHYEYKSKTEIGYGVTDWWKMGVEAELKNTAGENTEYNATEFVNKFQFWDKDTHSIDMGLYLAYETHRASSKADKIEAFLLMAKDFGSSAHRANIVLEQQIGSKRTKELELGVAWQSFWNTTDTLKTGFEYYGEFGEISSIPSYTQQEHLLGPVIKFYIPHTRIETKLGYLAGISSAAKESTFKWEFEYAF